MESGAGPQGVVRTSRIFTVPNVLSMIRLTSVPVFVWLFLTGREGAAVTLFCAAAVTDFLDGLIARVTGQFSDLGKLLDPLADRSFIAALALVLAAKGLLSPWLAGGLVARDAAVLAASAVIQVGGKGRITVNRVGKVATACLLWGLAWLAVSQTDFVWASAGDEIGHAFTVGGAVLYYVAGIMYGVDLWARRGSADHGP